MRNILFNELIHAHIGYWKNFFNMLNLIKKNYKNSNEILIKILKNNYPINAELKSGEKISLHTFQSMYFKLFADNFSNIRYDFEKDVVEIEKINSSNTTKDIKIFGGVNNGDIINGFLGKDYRDINVKDKMVIDIGANIGDTPIFFVCLGAKKVIGLEPFPKNFSLAQKNIHQNQMNEKIKMINAGCSSTKGSIRIDSDVFDTTSTISFSSNGQEIPLITINELIQEHQIIDNAILKIDCEGCEYDIIKNMEKNIFQKFSEIFIEYHNGYQDLSKILQNQGFSVNVSSPIATNVLNTIVGLFRKNKNKQRIGYVGFIHATMNSD